jgi:2-keto-4-pentenoate hydratase/2-oxohepta-3-ene-1,7-dioic acid hydratase in catechol pathway
VALDLTLRDLQAKMKKAGQPWEKAKGFDNSCPISGFIPAAEFTSDPQNTTLGSKSTAKSASRDDGRYDP